MLKKMPHFFHEATRVVQGLHPYFIIWLENEFLHTNKVLISSKEKVIDKKMMHQFYLKQDVAILFWQI